MWGESAGFWGGSAKILGGKCYLAKNCPPTEESLGGKSMYFPPTGEVVGGKCFLLPSHKFGGKVTPMIGGTAGIDVSVPMHPN